MSSNEQARTPIPPKDHMGIDRRVLKWLNDCPFIPVAVIKAETLLPVKGIGMSMSSITSAYINVPYIYGGYEADYTFRIIYRIQPGDSTNARLEALEMLNRMGVWCMENKPNLGTGISVIKVEPTTHAELFAPYENGDEDYFITMRIKYEVNI